MFRLFRRSVTNTEKMGLIDSNWIELKWIDYVLYVEQSEVVTYTSKFNNLLSSKKGVVFNFHSKRLMHSVSDINIVLKLFFLLQHVFRISQKLRLRWNSTRRIQFIDCHVNQWNMRWKFELSSNFTFHLQPKTET